MQRRSQISCKVQQSIINDIIALVHYYMKCTASLCLIYHFIMAKYFVKCNINNKALCTCSIKNYYMTLHNSINTINMILQYVPTNEESEIIKDLEKGLALALKNTDNFDVYDELDAEEEPQEGNKISGRKVIPQLSNTDLGGCACLCSYVCFFNQFVLLCPFPHICLCLPVYLHAYLSVCLPERSGLDCIFSPR